MIRHATIPWPGLGIAAAATVAMMAAGASGWLALGVFVLWAGTLWLTRPEPLQQEVRADRETVSRDIMRETIEPLGNALMLFERERVIAANAAARSALGAHIAGQDGRVALRHPEAVRLLDLPDGASVTARGLTGARSLWQLTRLRIDEKFWLVELVDRTSEADVSRAHTDFVANASHELRTPLSAVIGYVETLADAKDSLDAETRAKFLETVLREARRMANLVSDLMSLSQLEAEKHDAPDDVIDLGDLAARVQGEFVPAKGKSMVLLQRPETPLLMAGDTRQLEQMLRNLIDNALKYGDADKPVVVSLLAARDSVEVCIADQGPGIAADHLPHLTRRFYRTDPGRSRAAGGTGLGLAIVKHIVERHRGRLDISSKLGKGSRFTARFPLVEPANPA
jgi:two-component system, OmpR family, phosphate regulon sensor histidine kinase PhoR